MREIMCGVSEGQLSQCMYMITHIIIKWFNIYLYLCQRTRTHTHSKTHSLAQEGKQEKKLSLLISNIKYCKCCFKHVHHISFFLFFLCALVLTSHSPSLFPQTIRILNLIDVFLRKNRVCVSLCCGHGRLSLLIRFCVALQIIWI